MVTADAVAAVRLAATSAMPAIIGAATAPAAEVPCAEGSGSGGTAIQVSTPRHLLADAGSAAASLEPSEVPRMLQRLCAAAEQVPGRHQDRVAYIQVRLVRVRGGTHAGQGAQLIDAAPPSFLAAMRAALRGGGGRACEERRICRWQQQQQRHPLRPPAAAPAPASSSCGSRRCPVGALRLEHRCGPPPALPRRIRAPGPGGRGQQQQQQ